MRGTRWPWLLGAALLIAAGAAAAWSTYLHWLPCKGTMLTGSIFVGYAYEPEFSEACLRRMDAGGPFPSPPYPPEQTPWGPELGIIAMVLVGLAWLVITLGSRWSLRSKVVAALPSLVTFAVATQSEITTSLWMLLSIDASAVVAFGALMAWQPELRRRAALRVAAALWGAAAFGVFPAIFDYAMMLGISEADWDVPPGTGYLTAAVPVAAGILTAYATLRRPRTHAASPASASPTSLTGTAPAQH